MSSSLSSRPKSQKIIHIEDFEASCSTAAAPVTLSLSVEQHQTPKLFRGVMMPQDPQHDSDFANEDRNDSHNSNSNSGAFCALESSGQSTDSGGNTTGGDNIMNAGSHSLSASGDSDYYHGLEQQEQSRELQSTEARISALLDKSAAAGAAVDTTTGGEILNAEHLLH